MSFKPISRCPHCRGNTGFERILYQTVNRWSSFDGDDGDVHVESNRFGKRARCMDCNKVIKNELLLDREPSNESN